MQKTSLTSDQKRELERELRLEDKRKYADRIRVILLLDKNWTYAKIAEALFIDEGTIANYRRRYTEGGIEELITDDYNGKKSSLSSKQIKLLTKELEKKIYPSTAAVINYVKKRFRVEYSISGMTDLVHRLGFSYKKPKGVPGKANREQQENFVEQHDELKNKNFKIYFADSTHPQHNPILGYGWIKKGTEKEVFTNTGRNHINLNGAVDIKTQDVIVRSSDTVNAAAILELLKAIRAKNPEEKKIALVMDNARYNRAVVVRDLAKDLNIKLVYLPPYSPNLNPIERLWKFFKKKVMYNQYYETLEIFTKTCSEFFRCCLRKYKSELESLLTDNFHIVGT